MPLASLDIFLDGYYQQRALASDAAQLRRMVKQWNCQPVMDFNLALTNHVIIITDTAQRIVFASSNLTAMNGYLPSEVLGQTPRLFQGAATASTTRAVIRRAISRLRPFHVVLTNYRKSGEPYLCEIKAQPLIDKHHLPSHFIAFENIIHEY